MPLPIPNHVKDAAITAFRGRLVERLNITPLLHQAEWWSAADGNTLLEVRCEEGGAVCRLPNGTVERRATVPRVGGRARVLADLGSFKIGKSYGSALFAASFAIIPNARVQLIGLEYDICEPEFNYIVEFLLSERGMGQKADSLQNRPRDGKMWLDLPNGCRFEARSWERKDTLKGKEIDLYLYCEAYQLPGMECFTDFSQNLRARDGYAVFATTPDRPWVKALHDSAHSGDEAFKAWHCTCSVPASVNPVTYDSAIQERDRQLMTKEKFAIHYMGTLGEFVGSVYSYQRGQLTFDEATHPHLFRDGKLVLPESWSIELAVDTGTFFSALMVAFDTEGHAYVIDEFPNYDYKAGVLELDDNLTIPEWVHRLEAGILPFTSRMHFWADRNSQFRRELSRYGVHLFPNVTPSETRTEICREYFSHNRILLSRRLRILPFELENAKWPDAATASGKFERVKDRDHTLDPLEHILSRRPMPRINLKSASRALSAGEILFGREKGAPTGNPHLGRN